MSLLSRLDLQKRIMVYVTIWLVVISVVYTTISLRAIKQSTETVFQERLTLALTIADQLDSLLAHRIAELESVGDMVAFALERDDSSEIEVALENLCHHWTNDHLLTKSCAVSLVDPQGNKIWSQSSQQNLGESSPVPPVDFQKLTQIETTSIIHNVSETELSPPLGLIIVPVRDNNRTTAYLIAEINLTEMTRRLAPDLEIAELGYMIELVDQEGKVLVSPRADRQGKQSIHSSLFANQIRAGQADVQIHNLSGDDRNNSHILAYAPLKTVSWGVFVEQKENLALQLPHLLQTQLLLFGLFVLTVGLVTAWLATRRTVGPVKQLMAATQRIAQGDLEQPISVQRQDEIGQLATAFEQMRKNLVMERRRLQELAVLEERDRLAREMHDGFAQALGVLNLNAKAARQALTTGDLDHSSQALDALEQLIDQTYADVRETISSLRTTISPEKGLIAVVDQYLEEFGLQYGLKTQLILKETEDICFTTSQEIQLLRIIQEALSNVRKHAQASQVRIQFAKIDQTVEITIVDDGPGFDPATVEHATRQAFGLVIMRERAESLNGVFRLETQPGAGTTIMVRIPLKKDEGSDSYGTDAYPASG
jgi:signal transduction histidine kinase